MIQEYVRLARPYFVLLAIFAIGRWLMGTAFGVPYEKGTGVLSIVTLTLFASLFSAAYTRRWLGYRLAQAAGLAMFMALASQVVVLLSTAASYLSASPATTPSRWRSTARPTRSASARRWASAWAVSW